MQTPKKIVFMTKIQAMALKPEPNSVMISIRDPHTEPLHFPQFEKKDVLPLDFCVGQFISDGQVFSSAQAQEVVCFLKQKLKEMEDLVVYIHCTFAEQRSPSLARALCDYFECDLYLGTNKLLNPQDQAPVHCFRVYDRTLHFLYEDEST